MQNFGRIAPRDHEVMVNCHWANRPVKPGDDNQFVACGLPPTPAFQFCNRSHVDIDIPALAPAI
jgi:hypothetical protein